MDWVRLRRWLSNVYPVGNFVPPGSGQALSALAYLALLPFDQLTIAEKFALARTIGV